MDSFIQVGRCAVSVAARRRKRRLLEVIVSLALGGASALGGSVAADDFERLVASAGQSDVVPTLVTGWRAITGDEVAQGSDGDGPVAITGDEFIRDLQAASKRVSVTRRYENFPIMAMDMDAAALRHAKAYGTGVEIWRDAERYPTLRESTGIVMAADAWKAGYTGRGFAVVVIDTGIDRTHPFVRGRVSFEGCFASRCPNGQPAMLGPGAATPVHAHGTHVAGIVLGRSRSDEIYGVGPDLQLIAFNVADPETGGMKDSSILGALDVTLRLSAVGAPIGAVNMSLGSPRRESGVCQSTIFDTASRLFRQARIPVVVATGNDGEADRTAPVGFPACIDGFISVGAVTKSRQVASFSNTGPTLDLLAPGVDIRSSVPQDSDAGGYVEMDGTSMAAPHVAGAIALLKQAAPHASVGELLNALRSSGEPIRDQRNGVTAPLIHIGAALRRFGSAGGAIPPEQDQPVTERPPDDEERPPAEPPGEAPQPPVDDGESTDEDKDDKWKSITG